jgi:hypothetical protein
MTDELLLFVYEHIAPSAYHLLPGRMQSPEATAMLLAIGLQESRFTYRRQQGGPARGFWQFESGGGVKGVLQHELTELTAVEICTMLRYDAKQAAVYDALANNDVLAFCFARLLLWTCPAALPTKQEADKGWTQYVTTWRPGKPHRESWDAFYDEAWRLVTGE